MRIGDKVTVHCLETEKDVDGVLHKISKDKIEVVINKSVVIVMNKRPNSNLYVGAKSGLEFTTRIL